MNLDHFNKRLDDRRYIDALGMSLTVAAAGLSLLRSAFAINRDPRVRPIVQRRL
jgi:hypothetical protein